FPYGRESQIHEYLTPEMLLDTNVAAEKPEVLRDILTMLYIGQECRQAFLEPRRALAINFRTPTIPEDTPFFNPSTVPLRTDQDDVFLFMEEANFLMAFCEETGKGAVYKPTEADR
ncbi:MAG: hypothetical protein HY515_04365, partial [Candidatus Aenigmarchaeota archaeon]|nr:hypothetical protein [Candidatus Aenigmarchaeota archaeon]